MSTKRSNPLAVVLPPLIVGVLAIAGWYGISYGLLDKDRRFLLRPPHQVWNKGFADDTLGELWRGLLISFRVAMVGLLLAILIGFALAIIMSQARAMERAIFPYAVMLQAIPILAITPLIGFWWGYGFNSRVIVCVLIALFPIIVNTLFGLQSAEQGLHDLLTLHSASRLTRLRKLMFPAALPAIFAGLRISAGLSVVGAIVGDFFFGQGDVGIGLLMRRYVNRLEGEHLIASVITASSLGVLVFVVFGWISTLVVGKWATQSSR